MPQPVKHAPDAMMDAARALLLDGGPGAASARAVAAVVGAPSGSIYHRFPRRDDLVAATWLRAHDRFLASYLQVLSRPGAEPAAVAGAVLTWSRANPADAALLMRFGLADVLRDAVSPELAERAQAGRQRLADALDDFAVTHGHRRADVVVALVDLPYAVLRRVLREHRSPTADEVDSVRRAAALLLAVR